MANAFRDAMLPLLTGAYARGELVPFIGAGMSYPGCVLWEKLVANLEIAARTRHASGSPSLAARANQAVRVLKRHHSTFVDAVHAALEQHGDPPEQTRALVEIWWPLVLTTNYDDFFETAMQEKVCVVGRSVADCREVLSSLRAPSRSLLWALQGYLHCRDTRRAAALADELIIGHDEYRTVTHSNPYFRTAFAEVFRTRSLLFLGSGLQDQYLLDLFSETLEKSGPNPVPHFAFTKRGSVDAAFLRTSLNILTYEYDDHDDVPRLLRGLRDAISGARPRPVAWSFTTNAESRANHPKPEFSIERSVVPTPGRGECIAISCGYSEGTILYSGAMREHVAADLTLRQSGTVPTLAAGQLVAGGLPTPYYYVVARDVERQGRSRDRRDLRVIGAAVSELLSKARAANFRVVRAQLLSAGPNRTFPPVFSFIEMVRAFGQWRRLNPDAEVSFSVHVVDPSVLFHIETGRIDVAELLTGGPMRFWVQILPDDLSPQLAYHPPDERLIDVASALQVPANGTWYCTIEPSPTRQPERVLVKSDDAASLRDLGVVSFSTLRFAPS